MNVEATRQPEVFWHCWPMAKGLNKADAEKLFKARYMPGGFTYERFEYDHRTGIARTL